MQCGAQSSASGRLGALAESDAAFGGRDVEAMLTAVRVLQVVAELVHAAAQDLRVQVFLSAHVQLKLPLDGAVDVLVIRRHHGHLNAGREKSSNSMLLYVYTDHKDY